MIITAATVSIDSFIAGAALGYTYETHLQRATSLAIFTVASMCVAAVIAAAVIDGIATGYASILSGIVLIATALPELFKKEEPPVFMRKRRVIGFSEALATSFGVGIDGALATFSLALSGYGIWAAATVVFFHLIFIESGIALSVISAKINLPQKTGALLLLVLGIFKLVGLT